MLLALTNADIAPQRRWRLPPGVAPVKTLAYPALSADPLVGPLAGLYERYHEQGNNSQLLLGSRAGFAVSPRDATIVRFTVGPQTRSAGIVPGDHILAIYGLPLPPMMP